MTARRALHFRARHYLPSWQGGDVIYPACHATQHGAPRRAAWSCCEMTDEPEAVDCPGCRAAPGFPLPLEQLSAA